MLNRTLLFCVSRQNVFLRSAIYSHLRRSPFSLQCPIKPVMHRQLNNSPALFSTFSQRNVEIVYKDIDKSKYNVLLSSLPNQNNSVDSVNIQTKIDQILQKYEYIKYMSGHVPSDLSVEQMSDLIGMLNDKERERYIRYLFLTESRKMKDRLKKETKLVQLQQKLEIRPERIFGIFDENGELNYRLWGNTINSRITSGCISRQRTERKLRHASLFGQKLIIDLDYDDHMSLSECRIQVRHIVMLLIDNLGFADPYELFFTNCDYSKPTMKSLQKYFNTTPFSNMERSEHFTPKSYLDIFDRDRLVYLSPNAPRPMKKYSHDDIYIIGGFLDKTAFNKPVSHLKATREGIRQYRLPLDEHVSWGPGSGKNLCIMHMLAILNSLKMGASWQTALHEMIPKRKMKDREMVLGEQEAKRVAFLRRKLSIQKDNFNLNKVKEKLAK